MAAGKTEEHIASDPIGQMRFEHMDSLAVLVDDCILLHQSDCISTVRLVSTESSHVRDELCLCGLECNVRCIGEHGRDWHERSGVHPVRAEDDEGRHDWSARYVSELYKQMDSSRVTDRQVGK